VASIAFVEGISVIWGYSLGLLSVFLLTNILNPAIIFTAECECKNKVTSLYFLAKELFPY
jgi:hypothetical protein